MHRTSGPEPQPPHYTPHHRPFALTHPAPRVRTLRSDSNADESEPARPNHRHLGVVGQPFSPNDGTTHPPNSPRTHADQMRQGWPTNTPRTALPRRFPSAWTGPQPTHVEILRLSFGVRPPCVARTCQGRCLAKIQRLEFGLIKRPPG